MSEKPHGDIADFKEGMRLMKENDLEGAIEKFRSASTSGIERPMEHYALGVALIRNGQYAEARRAMIRFLQMSHYETDHVRKARMVLPMLERRIKESKRQAVEEAGRPLTLSDSASYAEGLDAYMRGDLEHALERFRETLREIPHNKHLWNNLGLVHLALMHHEQAIEHFEQALALDPHFATAYNNLGLAWNEYGAFRARTSFEAALEHKPDYFEALINLGALHFREGDRESARTFWQRAFDLQPDDEQLRRNVLACR